MLIGSCAEDYEDVISVESCAFYPLQIVSIVLGQAVQCLLGAGVPELWGKGILELKLIDIEYFKNKT